MRTTFLPFTTALLLTVTTALPGALAAQSANTLDPATAARVDQTVEQVIAETGIPSASVALVENGRIAYLHAYGKARLEPPTPATPEMQYPIGSVSKQFTATLILMLCEDGKMSLNDPVGKYLPQLTRANEVTVREILSMTSGYQDYWPEDYVMTSMMVPTKAQHILDVWAKKPLDFDPGTQWQYSNTNYVIAGTIAEMVGGKPLVEQLETRIFKPLHMDGVLNQDAARLPASDPIIGYYQHALGPLRPAPLEGLGWMFAAGELAMAPHDLALWNISLIDRSLLKPASYDAMFTNVKLKNGKPTGYGLGVMVGERDGQPVISHSGEVSGFVSQNTVYPQAKAAITVLTNIDASSAAGTIAQKLAPIVLANTASPSSNAAAAEARALKIFTGLQNGEIDRSQLTELCNNYFTQEALDDYASSLKPLGTPLSFTQVAEEGRGGMTFRAFRVEFPGKHLMVTIYEEPDGKLEQYLVFPAAR